MAESLPKDAIATLKASLLEGASAESRRDADPEAEAIELGNDERIQRTRLPGLEVVCDSFARSLRGLLARELGVACAVSREAISFVRFGSLVKQLGTASHLHLFRLSPLSGSAVLNLSYPLVYRMVDVLMGGRGSAPRGAAREFTAIENKLIAKQVTTMLESFAESWSVITPLESIYQRLEVNPQLLDLGLASENIVKIDFSCELNGECEIFELFIPYRMLEPLRDKLNLGTSHQLPEQNDEQMLRMREHMEKAVVTIRVELARTTIKLKELQNIKAGDIISLQTSKETPATVYVEDQPKLKATLGTKAGYNAITITGPLD